MSDLPNYIPSALEIKLSGLVAVVDYFRVYCSYSGLHQQHSVHPNCSAGIDRKIRKQKR